MRLAFYAPMKPPDHPVPSGDRVMGRLLMRAWEAAGHEVELASRLVSREPADSPTRQRNIAACAAAERDYLTGIYGAAGAARRPDAWFTYHVYYKAPDWLGPGIARALGIPYLIAEASIAQKRATGPYAWNHRATVEAVAAATHIFVINPADRAGLIPAVESPDRLDDLPAFLDTCAYAGLERERPALRRALALRYGLDADPPWLISVAMMRAGDKLASYRILGQALRRLLDLDWRLLVVGDGPARPEVETALDGLGAQKLCYLGRLEEAALRSCYAASDLCLWPAVNEAYGMSLLEAQAAGLPVVAGTAGGVASIVASGETGLLTPVGDVDAFAAATRTLIEAPARRATMGEAAREKTRRQHDNAAAARLLDRALVEARREHGARA